MTNVATISLGAGLAIIAAVVILIIVIVCVSRSKARNKTQAAPAQEAAPAAEVPAAVLAKGLDAKTVAVIMAAVAAALGRPAEQLRFRAVRHEGGMQTAWASAGTYEIIRTRQQYL